MLFNPHQSAPSLESFIAWLENKEGRTFGKCLERARAEYMGLQGRRL